MNFNQPCEPDCQPFPAESSSANRLPASIKPCHQTLNAIQHTQLVHYRYTLNFGGRFKTDSGSVGCFIICKNVGKPNNLPFGNFLRRIFTGPHHFEGGDCINTIQNLSGVQNEQVFSSAFSVLGYLLWNTRIRANGYVLVIQSVEHRSQQLVR